MKFYLKLLAIFFGVIALAVLGRWGYAIWQGRSAGETGPGKDDPNRAFWVPRWARAQNKPVTQNTGPTPTAINYEAALQETANRMRVTITGYTPGGMTADISLEWPGTNTQLGIDFVEDLRRQNVIESHSLLSSSISADANGQRVWQNSFRLKYR